MHLLTINSSQFGALTLGSILVTLPGGRTIQTIWTFCSHNMAKK